MVELKTQKNDADVLDFIHSIEDETKQQDSLKLLKIFGEVTGHEPKMWGTAIIGFDQYHYKSERSTQEGDWPLVAFSPRKAALTLYLTDGGFVLDANLLEKLGKHKLGKGCLYVKRLSDVDNNVLKQLITASYQASKKQHA